MKNFFRVFYIFLCCQLFISAEPTRRNLDQAQHLEFELGYKYYYISSAPKFKMILKQKKKANL